MGYIVVEYVPIGKWLIWPQEIALKYKGYNYKVQRGKRGGSYIVVGGKKVYTKSMKR